MSRLILIVCLLLLPVYVQAQQKQGAWWFFGDRVGINFNSGSPVMDYNSMMNSSSLNYSLMGAAASISDEHGNLLFTTDSYRVFNRKMAVMPNGEDILWGEGGRAPGSFTNSIIVQKPDSEHIYYIYSFAVMAGRSDVALYYITVDMRLDGGLGDVVGTRKITIVEYFSNRVIAALMHSNNKDVWIVTHSERGNTFRARLLTSVGLSEPIETSIGTYNEEILKLVSSPNSSKLCLVKYGSYDPSQLFDFDRSTGRVSNRIELKDNIRYRLYSACSFSPDNTKLYLARSSFGEAIPAGVLQYDLSTGDSTAIGNSATLLMEQYNTYNGVNDMQIAIDGKIYFITVHDQSSIHVIHCPNEKGFASKPELDYLHSRRNVGFILPMQNQTLHRNTHLLQAKATRTLICAGDSVQLSAYGAGASNYTWSSVPPGFTATIANPIVRPQQTTTYQVLGTGDCMQDTAFVTIEVRSLLSLDLGPDRELCQGTMLTAEQQQPHVKYLWSTGDTTSSIRIDTAGTYHVLVNNGACSLSDTVTISNILPLPQVASGSFSYCSGDTIEVGTAAVLGQRYRWLTTFGLLEADTIAKNHISLLNNSLKPDTLFYLREARLGNCIAIDTTTVIVWPRPYRLNLAGNRVVCPGSEMRYTLPGASLYQLQWNVEGGRILSQSDTSVVVGWGESNASAVVQVTATNIYGCSNIFTLPVRVNTLLAPVILEENLNACLLEAQGLSYHIQYPSHTSHYRWQAEGGIIVSGQGSATVVVAWPSVGNHSLRVSQSDTTRTDICYGMSQNYPVTIYASPDTTITIAGPIISCWLEATPYTYPGAEKSRYQWQATGGNIVSEEGNTVHIVWNEVGQGEVRVQEYFDDPACPGRVKVLPVTVHPLPETEILVYEPAICPESRSRVYEVTGGEGSSYFWEIQGGRLTEGQGTSLIMVEWLEDEANKRITVIETSALGCRGEEKIMTFRYDATRLMLEAVSVEQDEHRMRITYGHADTPAFVTPQLTLERKLPSVQTWEQITLLQEKETSFSDHVLETSKHSYRYRLVGVNSCGSQLVSDEHQSILLAVEEKDEDKAKLIWSEYQGWNSSPMYELWGRIDDAKELSLISQSMNTVADLTAMTGFTHCYRIKATASGRFSWSNSLCLEFKHILDVPNVITPNGDGLNETLVIGRLELYPGTSFTVYNRMGQKIYQNENYNNDWGATGLPTGVYYYLLQTKVRPHTLKGWIQVLR
jgi:gliding motility-associated-like protein